MSIERRKVLKAFRVKVKALAEDRYLAPDLEAAAVFVREGQLQRAAGIRFPELPA